MSLTVARVMHSETKKFRQRNAGETEAKRQMRKSIEAEQQMYLRHRRDFQYYMKQAKEKFGWTNIPALWKVLVFVFK